MIIRTKKIFADLDDLDDLNDQKKVEILPMNYNKKKKNDNDNALGATSLKLINLPARCRLKRCLSRPPVASFSTGNHPKTYQNLCLYICTVLLMCTMFYMFSGLALASQAGSFSVALATLLWLLQDCHRLTLKSMFAGGFSQMFSCRPVRRALRGTGGLIAPGRFFPPTGSLSLRAQALPPFSPLTPDATLGVGNPSPSPRCLYCKLYNYLGGHNLFRGNFNSREPQTPTINIRIGRASTNYGRHYAAQALPTL